LFCTSRRLIRRKSTVTYQCQYFTINSSISECDHKYETRNAEPEIGTDGSSQTRRNPRVDGYGSGFGPPRVSGSGFWTVLEPNRPGCAVQTRIAGGLPGPVANTNLGQGLSRSSHVAHISYGLYLICTISKGESMGHPTCQLLDNWKDQHVYLELLEKTNIDTLHTPGVHPIHNQFWQYPLCNFYWLWQPDELH